jgi:dTDP-4-dehydrorhamnose 3,5-epimerase
MIFTPAPLEGAFTIDLERHEDERGFFARSFCAEEFARHGLHAVYPQCSVSFNAHAGILRGLHYQTEPYAEIKIVRVTQGRIYDVIVDIRTASPTYRQWFAIELSAENRRQLYIPRGFAHGFQTLEDGCEVYYQISTPYRPEAARGIRWNDPAFDIVWPPVSQLTLSERDRNYPDYVAS